MGETPRLKTAIQKKDENGLTYYQRYYRLHKDEILEKTRKNNKKRRLYLIWVSMKARCANKDNKYYGAKDINVCDEWMDYNAFEKWALENGYASNLTIDRIDSNKGYCPDNCRWVTRTVQQRNRDCCHIIEYNGEAHCLTEWCEITGLSKDALNNRIRRGWTIERALTQKQIIKPKRSTK